jgi:hypothetical protein
MIPRKTDLATISDAQFNAMLAASNNTPRKCLDWRTPTETFLQVLHFECESTSPPSRGRQYHSLRLALVAIDSSARSAIASASLALRRASSAQSASCCIARESFCALHSRKASPTVFSRVK